MSTPTAVEQEILELINRARANPQGEFDALILDADTGTAVTADITRAIEYFQVDLDLFREQLAGIDPLSPLAWNDALADAATAHSILMIENDIQSHQITGEAGLYDRIVAAGYDGARTVGENIYAYAEDAIYSHAGFYIDWGSGPGGIQDPAGHRLNILSATFTEVGISAIGENNPSTSVGELVVTHDFGLRYAFSPVLMGTIIDDSDGDLFYDAGEGLGGVTVTATDILGTPYVTTTWDSGGYQLDLDAGIYTVTFSGGTLTGTASYQVTMGSQNTQLNAFVQDVLPAGTTGTEGADLLMGTNGNERIMGLGGDDTIRGLDGQDTLHGDAGDDILTGGESSTDLWDVIYGGTGNDLIDGGYGNDELRGDEGDDTINGGFGADTVIGGSGDDVLTGQALGDLIYGGDGFDFINGGFGHDRVNGGTGADRFFHLGIRDHGSDWIQDYSAGDGDLLMLGAVASRSQFQVNFTETGGAGQSGIEEAFVIYRPTGQILWALVDGSAQSQINLVLNGVTYDLLS